MNATSKKLRLGVRIGAPKQFCTENINVNVTDDGKSPYVSQV